MSDTVLTLEQFQPLLNQPFDMRISDQQSVQVVLIAAEPGHVLSATDKREPFSLLWRGPIAPVFPQRIYRIEHPQLGSLDMFIVPVGKDAAGVQYEAVFT